MSFIFRHYKTVLNRFPVSVQAVQAGLLMGAGDVIAQTFIENTTLKDIDWKRTAQFSSVGLIVIGPSLRVWYGILDKYIGKVGRHAALKKTAVDQLMFAPFFIGIVTASIGFAQGEKLSTVNAKLKRDYGDILIANYKLWPWVQLCNFYLIPLQHQVLTVQVVAVFWNTYLSWKTNRILDKST